MIHIVDDDEILLAVLAEFSKTFGFGSMRFRDSLEYLAFAGSRRFKEPTAVFCDVRLSDVNGFDMMRRVHEIHPTVRFVMISGYVQQEHAYSREACVFLIKPIGFTQLEKTFMHLRACNECGPSSTLVKIWPDHRERFGVCKRHCPFESEDCT